MNDGINSASPEITAPLHGEVSGSDASRHRAVIVVHTIASAIGILLVVPAMAWRRCAGLLLRGGERPENPGRALQLVLRGRVLLSLATGAAVVALSTSWGRQLFPPSDLGTGLWIAVLIGLLFLFASAAELSNLDLCDVAALEDEAQRGWLNQWLSSSLRNPLNTLFARKTMRVAAISLPAMVGVLVPPLLNPFTVVLWFLTVLVANFSVEDFVHIMCHNAPLRCHRKATRAQRLILWLWRKWVIFVLLPMHAKVYYYYLQQHNVIHHVENSGPEDTQYTLRYDRTSFFDYCRHATCIALDMMTGLWSLAYLRRHRRKRPFRRMATGLVVYYLGAGLLALWHWPAALILVLTRVESAPAMASLDWFWHGLTDPDDAQNIYTNSVNFSQGPAGSPPLTLFQGELHAQHHLDMALHWSRYAGDFERTAADYSANQGAVVIRPTSVALLIRHMWAREYDRLSDLFIYDRPDRTLIERRLARYGAPRPAGPALALDRAVSAVACRLLLGTYSPR